MDSYLVRELLDTPQAIFSEYLHGLEREALRIKALGHLALSPHPQTLGSALKHPHITTDFSEAQIEYTTAPYASLEDLLHELELLCNYVRLRIEPEMLWPFSMPALLPPKEEEIPLAAYGSSLLGRRKRIYRRGLAHRYGAKMQTISGLHYNFSFGKNFWKHYFALRNQEENHNNISEAYLGVMRNFLRHIYIMPYLFGNSPLCHKSFLPTQGTREILSVKKAWEKLLLWQKNKSDLYATYASSLRQSEIGYNHPAQWDLKINYNSMGGYLKSMASALNKVNPDYELWSVKSGEQLSQSYLQIENEHYAPIRPKRKFSIEKDYLRALAQEGIAYLELRCFDIQNESCGGVDPQSLAFTQLLLYHCLLEDSPPLETKEEIEIQRNYLKAVWEGRDPNCQLSFGSKSYSLKDKALALCEKIEPLAERLDRENLDNKKEKSVEGIYKKSLSAQIEKIRHEEATPSAKFLDTMLSYPSGGYIEFGCALAEKQKLDAQKHSFSPEQKQKMEKLRSLSLKEQARADSQQLF